MKRASSNRHFYLQDERFFKIQETKKRGTLTNDLLNIVLMIITQEIELKKILLFISKGDK